MAYRKINTDQDSEKNKEAQNKNLLLTRAIFFQDFVFLPQNLDSDNMQKTEAVE